jgi:MFS family permease
VYNVDFSQAPVYTAELAPPKLRGFFVGMNGMGITIGYSLASYMGLAFYYVQNDPAAQWRGPLGLALIFPAIQLLVILWAPESPRYLLMKGRVEEARKIVMDLHQVPGDPDQEYARGEFYQMQKQAEFDRSLSPTYKAMFFKKSYRKRTILACGFAFIGQSTAVLVINNYGPTLYAALGYGTLDQLKLQCGWITMGTPANLLGKRENRWWIESKFESNSLLQVPRLWIGSAEEFSCSQASSVVVLA